MTKACEDNETDNVLLEIATDVGMYAFDLNNWFSSLECPLGPLELQNQASLLQCRLLRWLGADGQVESTDHNNYRDAFGKALCITLLMFASRSSRQDDGTTALDPLHFTAVHRLKAALTNLVQGPELGSQVIASNPGLMQWILVIGAISAQGSYLEGWCAEQAALYTSSRTDPSTTFSEFLSSLRTYVWTGCKLDRGAWRLWEQMLGLRYEHLPYSSSTLLQHPLPQWIVTSSAATPSASAFTTPFTPSFGPALLPPRY